MNLAPDADWEPVRSHPLLAPGSVHVWRHDLAGASPLGADVLSSDERARAARLRVAERRHAFVRGRLLLRSILGRYLDCAPAEVGLGVDANEKPRIVGRGAEAIEINLSHSGNVLLVAVSGAGAVGVDVEALSFAIDHEAIARRFFAEDEVRALAAFSNADERRVAFFRCWTRKEAIAKAIGGGLAVALRDFAVSVGADTVTRPAFDETRWSGARDWLLCDLPAGDGYASALALRAYQNRDIRVRLFRG